MTRVDVGPLLEQLVEVCSGELRAQRDEALEQLRVTRALLYRALATIRCYEERLAAAEGRPVRALPPDLYDLAREVPR